MKHAALRALRTAALLIACCACTAAKAQQVIDLDLWTNGLPNSNGIDQTQPFDNEKRNFKPAVKVFLPAPEKRTGAAVVACPGGGYSHLATEHEGTAWAPFFNERGIALVVLTYRMPHAHWEVPLSDAREALQTVARHASEWGIDTAKVGIMGSSAGGHLATMTATHPGEGLQPKFQILFYPVVTMNENSHAGSRDNLLGKAPAVDLIEQFSSERQVTPQTPPAIMLLSADDRAVPPINSVNYFLALRQNGISATLHIYPSGGHGWGSKPAFAFHDQMLLDLSAWLRWQKLSR